MPPETTVKARKGGARIGAGRKPKFTEPTKRIVRMVPTRLIEELDNWLKRKGKTPKKR